MTYAPLLQTPHEPDGIGESMSHNTGSYPHKSGMEAARDLYDARAHSPNPAAVTFTPIPDKHEISAKRLDALNLALEFVKDCHSAEGYAHAIPLEMVRRAGRILAELRPTGYVG